ncbi:transglutaminase domain-containing protein [Mycoplasma anserisalpingitidis]|uniref:Transglutaminase domain-containing protein n=1 Tax=Mycoplasma anserisalpingitidis TaxID=519450 RepID=A0A5B8K7Q7_9MOLU|nr:transglutaminase domain-containing protein [Mycoplasma anserisalpingitidis]QDY86927.1 transglutaminase domain-containing protein [Mycoplasma anserisalpingitidis]
MKLLTHRKIKKNYINFIKLLNLIDKSKFISDKKIDIEKFDNILLSINKNKKKIDVDLFIQLIDFLLLFNSLGYLEINLFKFKNLIDYSLTKLQKTINKYTQPDELKKKINEFNFLVNSVLLFKEEKEYKEYCKIVDQTIKSFNNLLKSNINLSSGKITKKNKLILIIVGSISGFIAVSSAVIVPTTIHILNKDKIVPWTKLQQPIKTNFDLKKFNSIPEKYYNLINENILNKSEDKLSYLDDFFKKINHLNLRWLPLQKYYSQTTPKLDKRYKKEIETALGIKKTIDELLQDLKFLSNKYQNDIEICFNELQRYFKQNIKPTNIMSLTPDIKSVENKYIRKVIDNIVVDFNKEFINEYDLYNTSSFKQFKNFIDKLNLFIREINNQYLWVKDLKLKYSVNELDEERILQIYNDFKNDTNVDFDIWITRTIQNYIDYFSKGNLFPLIVERLTYFKNNFDFGVKEHTMQWFITKDKKYTLNPGNAENIEWRLPYMRDSKYGLIKLNSEYIISWLINYDEWLWVINDEEKIGEINLENVKAFNHWKDFNNEFIAEEFKNYENFYINISDWKYNAFDERDNAHLRLFHYINNIYGEHFETHNSRTHKVWMSFNKMTPINFDYDLFIDKTKQKYDVIGGETPAYELLTEQPNYFTDMEQSGLYDLQISKQWIIKETTEMYDFPNSTKLLENGKIWIDLKYYSDPKNIRKDLIEWRENWQKLLPKYISKKWNDKQIILAISYYINSNVMYMHKNHWRAFNTDGNNFFNPISLFKTDRTLQCYGYSQNLSMALTLLNIPVRILCGNIVNYYNPLASSDGHAWNEVFVDGMWKCVDLTFADYQENWSNFNSELDLNEIFLARDEGTRRNLRLDYTHYLTTIIKYLNKDENGNYVHNYIDLPTHYSTDPENELKWENMLPLLRKQYKTNQY